MVDIPSALANPVSWCCLWRYHCQRSYTHTLSLRSQIWNVWTEDTRRTNSSMQPSGNCLRKVPHTQNATCMKIGSLLNILNITIFKCRTHRFWALYNGRGKARPRFLQRNLDGKLLGIDQVQRFLQIRQELGENLRLREGQRSPEGVGSIYFGHAFLHRIEVDSSSGQSTTWHTLNAWMNGIARLSLIIPFSVRIALTLAPSTLSVAAEYASWIACTHTSCHSGKREATYIRALFGCFGSNNGPSGLPFFPFCSFFRRVVSASRSTSS